MSTSDRAIAAATAVLAKCAANDPWFPHPTEATILAWAEHIAVTGLHQHPPDLLAAVTAIYGSHGSGFKPLPGDVIGAARQIRADRFQRQHLADIEAHNDRNDERLGLARGPAEPAPPGHAPRPRPPAPANPLTVPCPYDGCKSPIFRRCTSGGLTMRAYHPSRIEAAKPPAPIEDDPWPPCTVCGTRPLVADEDNDRGTCDHCTPHTPRHRPNTHSQNGTDAA